MPRVVRNLKELYQYRALLWALSMRELKARYRASVLGFLWTFLNPTLNMLVYVLVFGVVMRSSVPNYPYYLFGGLLPWIYFSSSILGGTSSVSDRRALLTKVRFPAQVLPATVVLTNLINFLLSLPLLVGLGAFFGVWPTWHVVFVLPVLLVQTFFTLALSYFFAAFNVKYRDLQHIMANVVQMGFFLSPVLWDLSSVPAIGPLTKEQTQQAMTMANPMAAILDAWRDIFVHHEVPDWRGLLAVAVIATVVMLVSAKVFEHRREEFAELV